MSRLLGLFLLLVSILLLRPAEKRLRLAVRPVRVPVHEGADVLMTASFVEQIQRQEMHGLTSAEQSIESHLMSLAAEHSRVEQRIVSLDEMWKS